LKKGAQAIRAAAAILGNMVFTLLRNRRISFSQYGEDIAVLRCLSERQTTIHIYVDAGVFIQFGLPILCCYTNEAGAASTLI
jgi:hypothetical protein